MKNFEETYIPENREEGDTHKNIKALLDLSTPEGKQFAERFEKAEKYMNSKLSRKLVTDVDKKQYEELVAELKALHNTANDAENFKFGGSKEQAKIRDMYNALTGSEAGLN